MKVYCILLQAYNINQIKKKPISELLMYLGILIVYLCVQKYVGRTD